MIPYKDDNPTKTIPFITIFFIAMNLFVFILQILSRADSRSIVYSYGAIPYNILHLDAVQPIHPVFTIFTSMFLHGGLFHLGGNMLYLWIFGNNIEDRLGHIKFFIFYMFCGIVASFSHSIINPDSHIPMIGASGAVSGILGAYILLYPMAKVHTIIFIFFFIQIIKIPALIVIGFWAIIQVVNGLLTQGISDQAGVAWFAHIGGFLSGLFTIKLWLSRRNEKWL
jgi:membrane associated rhomboid family serine protease